MLIDEIYANLESVTESGCLVWTRCTNAKGYGRVRFHGKMHLVHRVVWEAVRGPIPPDLQIDHLCRVRACANVDHLEVVNNRTNVLRGIGITAQHARKMYCIQGHELFGNNLYKPSPNQPLKRICHICKNAQQRRRRARGRA